MKIFSTLLFFLLNISMLFGQAANLTGQVADAAGKPIVGANIFLYNFSDQLVSKTISDANGWFSIQKPSIQHYLLISFVGYQANKVIATDLTKLNVMLKPASNQMSDIQINGTRPFMQQEPDKLVVNVDGNPKAGINALDVLKKIPGVLINRDEISVEGKAVSVMIDGKQTRLSGNSLITLLEGSSSIDIGQIEIIYNPSAKYDAAGAGGLINIKTLKRIKPGYDANLSLTAGHGWKYPNLSSSASFNYKMGSNSLNLMYSQSLGKQYQELQNTIRQNDLNQLLRDSSNYNSRYRSHNIRLGIDHSLAANETIGVLLTGNYGIRMPDFTSGTLQSRISDGVNTGNLTSNNPSRVLNKGLNLNASYRKVFDPKLQKELTIDADAGVFGYRNNSKNLILETVAGMEPSARNFFQDGETFSKIYSLKTDYSQKLKRGTFETGLKISDVSLQNDFTSIYTQENTLPVDYGSNEFRYHETILAGYGNSRLAFGKFTYQFGLRAEQTFTDGTSVTLNNTVSRNYLNLFPNLSAGFKQGKNALSFSYGRRIGRPSYSELNPFVVVNSAFSSRTGNPYLKPSYTQNLRLGYSYNSKFSLSVSYATTKDVITDFQSRAANSEIIQVLKANVSDYQNFGLNMSYSNTFFKIWQLNYGFGISNSQYNFEYDSEDQEVKQTTGYLSAGNTFQLSKTFYAEVFFYGQSRVTYGTYVNLPFSTTSISAGKKIMKGNGNLTLNLNDIFFTGITRSYRRYGNIDYTVRSQYDSRNIRLNFSYRFGNVKIDGRKRNSASEEEQRRNQ